MKNSFEFRICLKNKRWRQIKMKWWWIEKEKVNGDLVGVANGI